MAIKKRGISLAGLSQTHATAQMHNILEAELKDIRQCVSQLEQELERNIIDSPHARGEASRAA